MLQLHLTLVTFEQFNMLVSYTYRSDDPLAEDDVRTTPSRKEKAPEMKTFTFYTVVDLGMIIPRPRTAEVEK
jgi:dynactin 4